MEECQVIPQSSKQKKKYMSIKRNVHETYKQPAKICLRSQGYRSYFSREITTIVDKMVLLRHQPRSQGLSSSRQKRLKRDGLFSDDFGGQQRDRGNEVVETLDQISTNLSTRAYLFNPLPHFMLSRCENEAG